MLQPHNMHTPAPHRTPHPRAPPASPGLDGRIEGRSGTKNTYGRWKSCTTLPGVSHFPGQPRPCEAGKWRLPRTPSQLRPPRRGAHLTMCSERRESNGCRTASEHCSAVLARTAALRHGGEACLDFKDSASPLLEACAARSRPTTRSTRGSWRGLTHDLCYPFGGAKLRFLSQCAHFYT